MTKQFHFWEFIRRNPKELILKNICTPMFTEVLLTTAKIWKQQLDKDAIYIYNGMLFGYKKE